MNTLQLYSVRDSMEQDARQTLRQVAALGYQRVEFAGFFGISPETLRDWLAENKLNVFGSHLSCDTIENDFDAIVRYHHTIGCDRITINRNQLFSLDAIDAFVKQVNRLRPRLLDEGIRLGFHNHRQELEKNRDGSIAYPHILERTELDLQLDVFWARVAGNDPVEQIHAFGMRLTSIHLKDGLLDGTELPFGFGEMDLPAIVKAANMCGAAMIVESETQNPSGIEEVRICLEYLKKLQS
ncbi:MAG: sugar phosphate isomerase/epimerase [Christensenella sp.]|nr:sugar phosphate isomerase/epimerase [Christensenella sp.]